MAKKNIIIDCDPGHDDAVALMMALAHHETINLLCVSTVGGNHDVHKVTKNAQNLLSFMKATCPLVVGQNQPLIGDLETGENAHGETGMNGPVFEESDYPIVDAAIHTYLYEIIKSSQEKVSILALGPLTNIALLLLTYPDIKDKIERILIMGGGIDKGNVTAFAEFNIYVDPHAARIVFNSGVPVVMAGLNVTEESYLERKEFDQWQGKGRLHQLYWELLDFYHESGKQFGFEDSAIHDAVPMAYLLDPAIFDGQAYPVHVVLEGEFRGATLADKRLKPEPINSIFVLETVNRLAFKQLINDALAKLEKEV